MSGCELRVAAAALDSSTAPDRRERYGSLSDRHGHVDSVEAVQYSTRAMRLGLGGETRGWGRGLNGQRPLLDVASRVKKGRGWGPDLPYVVALSVPSRSTGCIVRQARSGGRPAQEYLVPRGEMRRTTTADSHAIRRNAKCGHVPCHEGRQAQTGRHYAAAAEAVG